MYAIPCHKETIARSAHGRLEGSSKLDDVITCTIQTQLVSVTKVNQDANADTRPDSRPLPWTNIAVLCIYSADNTEKRG